MLFVAGQVGSRDSVDVNSTFRDSWYVFSQSDSNLVSLHMCLYGLALAGHGKRWTHALLAHFGYSKINIVSICGVLSNEVNTDVVTVVVT